MIFSIGILTIIFSISSAFAEFKCPKKGGVFRTVDLAYPSMDAGVRANPVYYSFLIYDSLLDMTYDLGVAPGLATEVPKKGSDGSYTFNLRKGVKFHDGTDFNAKAVAFNVDRLKSGKIASPYSGMWKKFLKNYEIIDTHKIKFIPNGEWPTFLWDVAASLRVASPTAVKNAGRDYGTKVAVGTGPFVMKSFKAKDHLHLDRNPNYYRKGLPCLGGFKAKLISSGSVRILKLKKGELDTINTFPESQFPQFKGSNLILQEGKFVKTIQKALKAATIEGRLITVGIKPNRPETGYGYIQYLESKNSEEALKVKTFTEKPNSKLAKTFIESGDFVWNSGIFVWKCSSLLSSFQKHMPDVAEIFDEGKEFFGKDAEPDFVSKAYLQVKNISIDYGLMEKSSDVYVILGDFGWSDLGSWYSLHELRDKDEHNNVVEANAMLYDTENSFIKVDSEKLVVVEGLKNYLINETENVLLICPLDGEKKFRDFVSNARKKGEDFI